MRSIPAWASAAESNPRRRASEKSFSAPLQALGQLARVSTSRSKTSMPRAANHWAMPEPITPEPITAVLRTRFRLRRGQVLRAILQKKDPDQVLRDLGIGQPENRLFLGGQRLRNAANNGLRRHVNRAERSGIMPACFLKNEFPGQARKRPAMRESRQSAACCASVAFPWPRTAAPTRSRRSRGASASMSTEGHRLRSGHQIRRAG